MGFSQLASDLYSYCSFEGPGNPMACATAVRNPDATSQDACKSCVLTGQPIALVRSAAQWLAQYANENGKPLSQINIESSVETIRPVGTGQPRTFGNACPLSAWDIDDMLTTFVDESRADGNASERCRVSVYNGYSEKAGSGDVVFAIFWAGSTAHGNSGEGGGGRAEAGLSAMADKNKQAGRPVAWTGFWKRNEQPYRVAGSQDHNDVGLLALSHQAFTESGFDFAYVAAFSIVSANQ